jgi:hypothetical protein
MTTYSDPVQSGPEGLRPTATCFPLNLPRSVERRLSEPLLPNLEPEGSSRGSIVYVQP